MSRRDNIENSDIISIYVDPYHDRRTGYNFRVNPYGVQADAYMFNDGERDWDWDAVWEAETWSDEAGWYAEIRIPFSCIRYRPSESMTWGLQIYRWMHGRGEDTGWVCWDRELSGFISRFGELRGLDGLKAPKQLEITPYIVQRLTDPDAEGDADEIDHFGNVGADIKYGVTANMTLTATVQPDFGQVEADPAVLNLSPFETFYSEKRPFFIEGARFFEHRDFDLFYSRRIGTGDENARIRFAGKLTGKTDSGVKIAALLAATDQAASGKAWNPFESGQRKTGYGILRVGKEFSGGDHQINLMQTGVRRDSETMTRDDNPRDHRNAYTSGADFSFNFKERTYHIGGSFVGSVVDPPPFSDDPAADPAAEYGTAGSLSLEKQSGQWRGTVHGSWESDRFDPNDLGRLQANDEIFTSLWLQRRYDSDGRDAPINQGNLNLNLHRSWLYAGGRAEDPANPGLELWSYDARHRQYSGGNVNGWCQLSNFWDLNAIYWVDAEGTSKYETRGGPLMTTPHTHGFEAGVSTDWRKDVSVSLDFEIARSDAGSTYKEAGSFLRWVLNDRFNMSLGLGYRRHDGDAQWLDIPWDDAGMASPPRNPGGLIGDTPYVFARLDQRTWESTLRMNLLFDRDRSLELYMQPFLTVGDYDDPRELARPDSYDLRPFAAVDFDVDDYDFSFAAMNLNIVYRWEYAPGSTLFVVWSHSHDAYVERADTRPGDAFDNDFSLSRPFRNEPENRFLVKMSKWFSI